jgi:hypothetical protein
MEALLKMVWQSRCQSAQERWDAPKTPHVQATAIESIATSARLRFGHCEPMVGRGESPARRDRDHTVPDKVRQHPRCLIMTRPKMRLSTTAQSLLEIS